MGIQRDYGKFIPVCDRCYAELPAEDTWDDAREAMQTEQWQTVREGGEWMNYCVGCYRDE